ncbi:MAG: hypothetical protein ACR2NS_00695 [Gemmatimonadaceae bacterium]
MRCSKAVSALGVSALLIGVMASSLAAQERGRGAPNIRVYSRTGVSVVSNYVEPAIEVSENAYVFAVSLDLDGQIQVLQPDFPGLSVRIARGRELRLPNFFAGFSNGRTGVETAYGRNVGNVSSMGYAGQENDTRGTVIALASRAPFNLDRIESGGDWNVSAIRGLIEYRSPAAAAQALASYLGAKGEPIGRDYMRFASARQNYYAYDYVGDQYACYSNSSIYALSIVSRISELRAAGQRVNIVGYDYCGMPIVVYGPSRRGGGVYRPTDPLPIDTGDSRNRLGHGAPPRSGHPPKTGAALGFFPPARRATPPQAGDVTITAPVPPRRGRDPREVLIELQNQGNGGAFADGNRIPRGSVTPPRAAAAAIGAEPVRTFNQPVLRAAPPPPPPRTEPTRSPPPATTSAPPPPPRTAAPHTNAPANPTPSKQ